MPLGITCGEWVRLGKPVDLHEDVPGAGAMLLEEGTPLLLEVLVATSRDYVHHAVPIGDRGLQLCQATECRLVGEHEMVWGSE
jgi:hypothetical protein